MQMMLCLLFQLWLLNQTFSVEHKYDIKIHNNKELSYKECYDKAYNENKIFLVFVNISVPENIENKYIIYKCNEFHDITKGIIVSTKYEDRMIWLKTIQSMEELKPQPIYSQPIYTRTVNC